MPDRPIVNNGYVREFVYVYGAVSPLEGERDWMICPKMNTERMGDYLAHVAGAHPTEFIVMVIDGASSHVAKALVVPDNIRVLRLPPLRLRCIPRSICGTNFGRKSFRTECSLNCRASSANCNTVYRSWPPTMNACEASPRGLG